MTGIVKHSEFKKFSKGFQNGTIYGAIFSSLIVLAIMFFIWFLLVGIIDFGVYEHPGNYYGLIGDFLEYQKEKKYNKVSEMWDQHKFVTSLSYLCSFRKTEIGKINCTKNYIRSIYNYTEHGIGKGTKLRYSPEEIAEHGGVCRDYSVLYSSIFKRMGIDHKIEKSPGHLYVLAYPEEYSYCFVDMEEVKCCSKKEELNCEMI